MNFVVERSIGAYGETRLYLHDLRWGFELDPEAVVVPFETEIEARRYMRDQEQPKPKRTIRRAVRVRVPRSALETQDHSRGGTMVSIVPGSTLSSHMDAPDRSRRQTLYLAMGMTCMLTAGLIYAALTLTGRL
jgi:hypothetical protein